MNPFTIISNLRNSSSITINGKVVNSNIISDGCNITIDGNNNVLINGHSIEVNDKVINIVLTGNVNEINVGSGDVEVEGDVLGSIQTGSGDVEVSGSVNGSIKTGSGDITVGR